VIAISHLALVGSKPQLKHFKMSEFGAWFPYMDSSLLKNLDDFRELWGRPVSISPASGTIGRMILDPSHANFKSGHNIMSNILKGQGITAIDIMPQGLDQYSYSRAFELAKQVGFTAIGIYPDWKPMSGMHLEMRKGRTSNNPAKWAGVRNEKGKQVYINIDLILI
jgi:hypothetical protein